MKRSAISNYIPTMMFGCAALFMPITAKATDDSKTPSSQLDHCAKELLLSYFPESFVNETLKKFNVPQDKWANINKTLNGKDKDIIKIVEEKASKMNPNPLKDPQQRQAAVKLFRETLLQTFGDALRANGVKNENDFQAMLDDIQQQKAKKFAECMKKQSEHLVPPLPSK